MCRPILLGIIMLLHQRENILKVYPLHFCHLSPYPSRMPGMEQRIIEGVSLKLWDGVSDVSDLHLSVLTFANHIPQNQATVAEKIIFNIYWEIVVCQTPLIIQCSTSLFPQKTLWDRDSYCIRFTDEEMETQNMKSFAQGLIHICSHISSKTQSRNLNPSNGARILAVPRNSLLALYPDNTGAWCEGLNSSSKNSKGHDSAFNRGSDNSLTWELTWALWHIECHLCPLPLDISPFKLWQSKPLQTLPNALFGVRKGPPGWQSKA